METYYTIYKVTNLISGKFYVGSHKTKNIKDGYMGSGKYLKHAINKHGIENFKKEILFVFDNPEEMYAKEAEIVNEDFLAEENTYNLKVGGFGGFDYINENGLSSGIHNNWMNGRQRTQEEKDNISKRITEVMKDPIRLKKATEIMTQNRKDWTGKIHSEETKLKISQSAKERLKDPTKNSQYGTMWITNGIENKKIKKTDPIPSGWMKGRKINS